MLNYSKKVGFFRFSTRRAVDHSQNCGLPAGLRTTCRAASTRNYAGRNPQKPETHTSDTCIYPKPITSANVNWLYWCTSVVKYIFNYPGHQKSILRFSSTAESYMKIVGDENCTTKTFSFRENKSQLLILITYTFFAKATAMKRILNNFSKLSLNQIRINSWTNWRTF